VPTGYDASQLVLEDAFCEQALDEKNWRNYLTGFDDRGKLESPLSGPNEGTVEAEYFSPSQVVVADGLRLTAAPDKSVLSYTAKSGVITTPPGFTFGDTERIYLQVRAKVPATDGMWAKAYFGPLVGVNATTVGIFSSGFTDDPSKAAPLSNFQLNVGNKTAYVDPQTDLSTAPSDFGVEIVWGQSVTWFWNAVGSPAKKVHQETSPSASIPPSAAGETLILALSVVNGNGGSNGWHTVWSGASTDSLQITEVQAYAR
jgi:hypothetical protein